MPVESEGTGEEQMITALDIAIDRTCRAQLGDGLLLICP